MLPNFANFFIYGTIILSLFTVDYILGQGFLNMSQKILCKMVCFVKRTLREEMKQAETIQEMPISWSALLIEISILSLTIAFLNKYKQFRCKDRIDDLLEESKDALRQTNEFLEKWRVRRIPTDYSYLDDEPQDIKSLKIEVPILHMAIIDTLGTTRSKPERGDAGDTINITDATLLSMTSLIDEDLAGIVEPTPQERIAEEKNDIAFRSRYLWDVMEEDANNFDD